MENQFNEKFTAYYENKTQKLIISNEKYEEIVSTIQKYTGIKLEKLPQNHLNTIVRFSLHTEQSIPTLYHQGEGKELPQKIVKYHELFGLLQKTHKDLEHEGISIMWRELRSYYGISK